MEGRRRMNRHTMLTAVVAAILVVNATAARAQSTPRRGYVEGGILADIDPDTYAEGADVTPAPTFAAGYTFASRWTVRAEGVVPLWHTHKLNETYSFSGRTTTETGTQQHRLETYSFLTGYEFRIASKLRLTPMLGVGASRHTDKIAVQRQMRLSTGAVTAQDENSTESDWYTSLTFGADFAIDVSPRLAVVPQFRFDGAPAYSGLPRFRSGVTLRFGF